MAFRRLSGGSRFVRWALAAAFLALAAGVVAVSAAWTAAEVAAVAALLLLALGAVAPVRFEWAGRTVAVLVVVGYGAFALRALRGLRALPGAAPDVFRPPSAAVLAALLVAALAAVAWTVRSRAAAAVPLAPDDPLVAEATRRARQSLPDLRRLRAEDAGDAAVKWAFTTDAGEVEHVWGAVLALHLDEIVVRMLNRPVTQRARVPASLTIPLAAIEDWQVTLPDGSVRGSFSTMAMIAACRRDGRPVPRALRNARLLDADESAPGMARGAAS